MPALHFSLVSLVLVLLTISIANGWVVRNFHDTAYTNPRLQQQICQSGVHHRHSCRKPITFVLCSSTAKDKEEEETIEYIDEDEDEDDSGASYDPQAALEKQADWMEELLYLSKATSIDPTAVESAQDIFDAMFQAYVKHEDSAFFPTVEVYNLLLETHAYSLSKTGAEEAEGILAKMEDPSNDFVARPNEATYLCVMDAWAIRRQPSRAKAIVERQESPTIDAHNKLIRAYGMAGDFGSAESLFRSLLGEGTANHKSWVQIMKASVSLDEDDDDDDDDDDDEYTDDDSSTVESLFQEMQDGGFDPETDAYNVLIRSVGKKPKGFQKAEAILFDMIASYRDGIEAQKPNAGTFRALLTIYHKQGPKKLATSSSAAKVEQLLQFMEGLTTPDELEMHFSDSTVVYRMAMDVIGWSKDPKKAAKAQRILRKQSRPTLDVYVSVLKACSGTHGTSQEKFAAFQIALGVLKDLRAHSDSDASEHAHIGLTSSTMGLFLQSCHRLMPEGPKRDELVTKVFKECSEKGLVNEFVLDEFEAVASETIQLQILGGFSVDGVSIPESWSRNVVA